MALEYWELLRDQGESYGLAYRNHCDYHGRKPSPVVDCEGPCFICWYDISSPVLKCTDSPCGNPEIGIRDSCSRLPSEMQYHDFHSHHTLTLCTRTPCNSGYFVCDVCGRTSWGFNFHCEIRGFVWDPHCATSLKLLERLSNKFREHLK